MSEQELLRLESLKQQKPLLVFVDDERPILMSLRSLFHHEAYDVQFFSSGIEALEYLTHHSPDIIVSDMRMPEMNGMEFLQRAAVMCPSSARLMLSGYEDKNIILDALNRDIAQQYVMKPWEDPEMLHIIGTILSIRKDLKKRHIDNLLKTIKNLPVPPQAQDQIKRVLKEKNRSIRELAGELERNPALVARILRVSNSVYFASRSPITNMVDAITFIGTEYIEGLVLAGDVFNGFERKSDQDYMRWLEELWHHSLQRAFIGRMIAGKWAGLLHPQIAYTTCLLLDVGYVIRLFSDYDKFKDMMNLTQSLQISLHEAEEKVFEVGHAEVGAALLRSWNFPEDIVVAIAQHHHNTENDVFTKIAQIANALESGKYSEPHDPSINELIETWRLELYPKISKGSTA